MLGDAFAAEHFKFWRNRNALFFGFAFAPLMTLLFNVAVVTYLYWRSSGSVGGAPPVNLADQVVRALALCGSSFVQIFFVAGATAIFAGEYRWETWRLLTARSSRLNLFAAKFLVYGVWCAFSLIAFAGAALLYTLYGAVLNGVTPAPMTAGFLGAGLGVFLASWAELMVLGALTALVAVAQPGHDRRPDGGHFLLLRPDHRHGAGASLRSAAARFCGPAQHVRLSAARLGLRPGDGAERPGRPEQGPACRPVFAGLDRGAGGRPRRSFSKTRTCRGNRRKRAGNPGKTAPLGMSFFLPFPPPFGMVLHLSLGPLFG